MMPRPATRSDWQYCDGLRSRTTKAKVFTNRSIGQPFKSVGTDSLCLDPSRLDDRPPFLDLGQLQPAERLRRLLLARVDVLSKIGKPATHCRIGQGFHDCGIELGDDVL